MLTTTVFISFLILVLPYALMADLRRGKWKRHRKIQNAKYSKQFQDKVHFI